MLPALVVEAVATFALCLVGGGAIMTDAMLGESGFGLLGIALAHGIVLSIGVSWAMNISGGHVNPAVTIGMLAVGRIPIGRAAGYIAAQLLGGIAAGAVLSVVLFVNAEAADRADVVTKTWNGTPYYDVMKLGDTPGAMPATAVSERGPYAMRAAQRALIIEAVITFLLMFAIFGTAVDPRAPKVGGFGIGLMVGVNILLAGPLTGAAMNPARVLGTGLFIASPEFWSQHWVYWVGPTLGAIVAAFLYQFVVLEKKPRA
ncbi:MAG: aquaporin [Phycisphaerae bacterium]